MFIDPRLLPPVALAGLIIFVIMIARGPQPLRTDWRASALLALLFALWTVHAIISEGLTGFWREHVRNAWGNQIWFDLLIAFGFAWTSLCPRARALNMRITPWLIAFFLSGSIALLAMLARIQFLEQAAARQRQS